MNQNLEKLEELERMILEDYAAHEERLWVWIAAAEEELTGDGVREEIYSMLFWAQTEFHRRRVYLGLDMPEIERRAAEVLIALGDRAQEFWRPDPQDLFRIFRRPGISKSEKDRYGRYKS